MKVTSPTLGAFLYNTNEIAIPLYQRPYCWDAGRVEILLNDIYALTDENAPENHFLGALVFERDKDDFFVVDGQQRLTTIFLLLNALNTDAAVTVLRHCRFIPAERDQRFYRELCSASIMQKGSNMASRYAQIDAYVKSLSSHEKVSYTDVALNRIQLVIIEADEHDNAYEIFEGLNFKGEPLEQFDLIRNFLIMQMRDNIDQRKQLYRDYIRPIEEIKTSKSKIVRKRGAENTFEKVERGMVSEFLTAFVEQSGEYVAEKELYTAIKRKYNFFTSTLPVELDDIDDAVVPFLMEMNRTLECFYFVINPEAQLKLSIALRERLTRLLSLDTEAYFSLALTIITALDNGKITESTAVDMLASLETFIVRSIVLNNRLSKSFRRLFASVIQGLNDMSGQWTNRAFQNLLVASVPAKNKSDYIMDNDEFAKQLNLYSLYENAPLCVLALKTLERLYSESEYVSADFTQIEHIMPQRLSADWLTQLGEDAEFIHFRYVNTIGNLTLLPHDSNIQASNRGYKVKRNIYIDSKFSLNAYFKNVPSWDENAITERGKLLSQQLTGIWSAFTDVDITERNTRRARRDRMPSGSTRAKNVRVAAFTFEGARVVVSSTKGTEMMQKLYTMIYQKYHQHFPNLAHSLPRVIAIGRPGDESVYRGKGQPIDGSDYVVNTDTSFAVKLADIGRTLRALDLSNQVFFAETVDGEFLYS